MEVPPDEKDTLLKMTRRQEKCCCADGGFVYEGEDSGRQITLEASENSRPH
jgi:hypothetical protein